MKVQLSIVIPVYNVEAYLSQCLDSIVSQKYDLYEIILVNDGSTDGSGDICSRFAEKYNFIHVINKHNEGLSQARNIAVEAANGQYIMFVDADDYIAKNSLSLIGKELEKGSEPDLVFLRAAKLFPNGKTKEIDTKMSREMFYNKPQQEVLRAVCEKLKFPGSAWAKIIKKSVITQAGLLFEAGKTAEDLDFVLQLILHCNTFDYYDFPFYCYRQRRQGSITYNNEKASFEALFRIVKHWADGTYQKQNKAFVYGCAAYEYTVLLYYYSYIDRKLRIIYASKMKDLRYLLKMRKGLRYTFIRLFLFTFGQTLTSKFMRFLYLKLQRR